MSTLSLIQIDPDREAFGRWSALYEKRLGLTTYHHPIDNGYAWHALLTAVFGNQAPRPFVDRQGMRSNLVLGYVPSAPDQLQTESGIDVLARQALNVDQIKATRMPERWQQGQSLSFEVRCRPIVRTRRYARSGKIDEMDAAVHAALKDPQVSREAAYGNWLERELARNDACRLEKMRMASFRRTRIVRRSQGGKRQPALIEGPESWLVGRLVIRQPAAFEALLRRGLGRHRAFGFGCLILAQPGVLDQ